MGMGVRCPLSLPPARISDGWQVQQFGGVPTAQTSDRRFRSVYSEDPQMVVGAQYTSRAKFKVFTIFNVSEELSASPDLQPISELAKLRLFDLLRTFCTARCTTNKSTTN